MPVRQLTDKEIEELKEFDKTEYMGAKADFSWVYLRLKFYKTVSSVCKNHASKARIKHVGRRAKWRYIMAISQELWYFLDKRGWPVRPKTKHFNVKLAPPLNHINISLSATVASP